MGQAYTPVSSVTAPALTLLCETFRLVYTDSSVNGAFTFRTRRFTDGAFAFHTKAAEPAPSCRELQESPAMRMGDEPVLTAQGGVDARDAGEEGGAAGAGGKTRCVRCGDIVKIHGHHGSHSLYSR